LGYTLGANGLQRCFLHSFIIDTNFVFFSHIRYAKHSSLSFRFLEEDSIRRNYNVFRSKNVLFVVSATFVLRLHGLVHKTFHGH
jgi:hypothetical protein